MTIDDVPQADNPMQRDRRKRLFTLFAGVVILSASIWGLWHFLFNAGRVSTDNAYVGAEIAQITPRISSTVLSVHAANTQLVKANDILLRLDDADAKVDLAMAEAALVQAEQRFAQARFRDIALRAQVTASRTGIDEAQARVRAASANLARAEKSLQRRDALIQSGAVSGEELTVARADLAEARATFVAAQAGLVTAEQDRVAAQGNLAVNQAVTRRNTAATDPDIVAARARVAQARLNLDRTILRAPVSGVVAQRQVQVGQRVAAGAVVMVVVPVDAAYVDANFKESQLRNVKVGQAVRLEADLYGGNAVYHGRVVGLAAGTGAVFSLIPAQNASGNWVKVVQRLPVRIALDPAELQAHPLRVGLSMHAEIDTRAP